MGTLKLPLFRFFQFPGVIVIKINVFFVIGTTAINLVSDSGFTPLGQRVTNRTSQFFIKVAKGSKTTVAGTT